MPGNWGSPADFAKQWIAELILLSVLVFGVRYVMRFNILGCFLVVAMTALSSGARTYGAAGSVSIELNGYGVIVALGLAAGVARGCCVAGRGDLRADPI